MATNPLTSPVVVDGIVSTEKVTELLALQTEYPELDYKTKLDLSSTEGRVDLVAVVGSMGVKGGYILGGVDDDGQLTGLMDTVDLRAYDEASLRQILQRFLPRSIELSTNVVEREGHKVVAICATAVLSR
ncbi:MAG: ATP-binding protein [Actinobacteria bacterium]|nr:ATP-binding protein [Actinomycetota bacterium]